MFTDKFYNSFKPDFVYTEGKILVPSKALKYKTDPDTKQVTETTSPLSKKFEQDLREFLSRTLENEHIFPTTKEVFVMIVHGFHGKKNYSACDLDNKAKLILDALKGPIYLDDSQVKILWTYKHYLLNSQESYYSLAVKFFENDQMEIISSLQKIFES